VDPSAVEPDEEFRDDDDDKRGPKEVWRPKEGTPEMAPTTESGTLASERHVGTRAEDDSGGVESEAHASVRRDLLDLPLYSIQKPRADNLVMNWSEISLSLVR